MTNVSFHGHQSDFSLTSLIALDWIHADPQKTTAVTQLPVPSDVSGIQRFMGMVNHLGKFIPNLADLSDPLCQLLRKDSVWVWAAPQQKAFGQIKQALVSPTVLAHYNPNRPMIISGDASNTGIGAVLFQVQDDGERRLVCYASRSLSDTKKRYAVIEKEALTTTWASERFSDYRIYPCVSRPFMASKEAPKTALDLYTGQRF